MMLFGGLFMLLFAVLIIAGVVAVLIGLPMAGVTGWRLTRPPSGHRTCPSCGRALRDDWRVCPYDGAEVRIGA